MAIIELLTQCCQERTGIVPARRGDARRGKGGSDGSLRDVVPGGVGQGFPGTRSWTTFFIETPDVTASLEKAQALGSATRRSARYSKTSQATLRDLLEAYGPEAMKLLDR